VGLLVCTGRTWRGRLPWLKEGAAWVYRQPPARCHCLSSWRAIQACGWTLGKQRDAERRVHATGHAAYALRQRSKLFRRFKTARLRHATNDWPNYNARTLSTTLRDVRRTRCNDVWTKAGLGGTGRLCQKSTSCHPWHPSLGRRQVYPPVGAASKRAQPAWRGDGSRLHEKAGRTGCERNRQRLVAAWPCLPNLSAHAFQAAQVENADRRKEEENISLEGGCTVPKPVATRPARQCTGLSCTLHKAIKRWAWAEDNKRLGGRRKERKRREREEGKRREEEEELWAAAHAYGLLISRVTSYSLRTFYMPCFRTPRIRRRCATEQEDVGTPHIILTTCCRAPRCSLSCDSARFYRLRAPSVPARRACLSRTAGILDGHCLLNCSQSSFNRCRRETGWAASTDGVCLPWDEP